jgi:CheY-like chemotaxis protein
MDAATRGRMFEPFFTTKPQGKGTGLGLATVYGLVQQHGGGIDVHSEPGKGTHFRIYFPIATEAATATRRAMGEAEVRGGSETVLVVEDDHQLRRSAKRILEEAGYQVLTAADGLEALEALRQTTGVRLVFSDLVMPRLGGRGLYDAARREGQTVPFRSRAGTRPQTGRRASIPRARCSTSRGRRRICWDGCERSWIGKRTRRAERRVESRRPPERFRFPQRPLVPRFATRRARLSPSAPASPAQTASVKMPRRT